MRKHLFHRQSLAGIMKKKSQENANPEGNSFFFYGGLGLGPKAMTFPLPESINPQFLG